jgi:hypothetical protein
MKSGLVLLPISCLLIMTSGACQRPEPEDPQAVYAEFYRAASAGEWPVVYNLLDSGSRRCIDRVAQLLARQSGTDRQPLAFYLQQLQGQRQGPLRQITLVERQGDRAELEVVAGPCDRQDNCGRRRVKLVREDGRWRVRPDFERPLLSLVGREEC